jgi:hypothetical protein
VQTSEFNYKIADSQATAVEPVAPEEFPFSAYRDYEESLRERCCAFWNSKSGVLVYRRMRVGACFSSGCRDMAASLRWQLGALAAGMNFPADIPNFLEPWYGIGTVASAFGEDYLWAENQAPAIRPRFESVDEALAYPADPVAETAIGRHTLRMIEYFLDATGGQLPISLTDTQSPWNAAGSVVNAGNLMLEVLDDPEGVKNLLARLSELVVEFTHRQLRLLSNAVVWPGHGFGSSRDFQGMGLSDDNILTVSNAVYRELIAPSFLAAGQPFGGTAFHSCGDWSKRTTLVRQMAGVKVVDAAFSRETDPKPNPPTPFREVFAHSGIVLQARIVGSAETVADCVRQLWGPGMRLIVVTYCSTPEEQAEAYRCIHNICQT